ncbi:MAG TPA: ABC transporter ATP-binding protein [Pseudobacteroides sp.]|uniref:ABC transporter ATP-binding protein n=1 Tax=Pseudobacteroides sp. TaxID=1968840 RepID=UPI002F94E0B3
MVTQVLELTNVSKRFGSKDIVKDVNLSVFSSEIFGFLGPNGAGKTTTIRMIVGLIKPSSGEISICGFSLKDDYKRAMSNVGCIIESPDMYKYLTGMENLQQFAAMDKRITRKRIDEVVEMVGLTNRINDKVSTYSLGMRQRLGIAQAIMGRPKLLILDEPTNGLDPAGIAEFRHLIRRLAYEEGMAVFISSHILSELQLVCDTVAIVSKGRVVKSVKVSEIAGDEIVEWHLNNPSRALQILMERWNINGEQTRKSTVRAGTGTVRVEDINQVFFSEGLKISYCESHGNSLEELFLNLTEGDEIV